MRFNDDHMAAFAQLSSDTNPLHADALYAGRTSFGQPVVYGVATSILALGNWTRGRQIVLTRVRCTFRKPLFLGTDYELVVREEPKGTVLSWCRAGVVQSETIVSWVPAPSAESIRAAANFEARLEARDDGGELPPSLDYDIDTSAEALRRLGLGDDEIPLDQVRTLCGLSYIVGMETPGRQALFTKLDVTFGDGARTSEGPYFRELATTVDERFGRTDIKGRTAEGARFAITAFARPRARDANIDEVAARLPRTRSFAGRCVVLTGASRGFGAALAKAFAVEGAAVVIHCRAQRAMAEGVAEEIRRFSTASIVESDLASDAGAASFATDVVAAVGVPDVLVLNATPPIEAHAVHELPSSALCGFVHRSLALVHGPLRELVPRMKKGSVVVVISSLYVSERPEKFGHYVAAKCAIEGLVAVMAKEHPAVRFVSVRPPPMLTDQTNVLGLVDDELASTADVAARLLSCLASDANVIDL